MDKQLPTMFFYGVIAYRCLPVAFDCNTKGLLNPHTDIFADNHAHVRDTACILKMLFFYAACFISDLILRTYFLSSSIATKVPSAFCADQ